MDVYKSSVSWDGAAITPVPTFTGLGTVVPRSSVYLMAANVSPSGSMLTPPNDVVKAWGIQVEMYGSLALGASDEYRVQFIPIYYTEIQTAESFADPDTWAPIFNDVAGVATPVILDSGFGTNGAAYLAGGTLEIEKDEAANAMRFITPLGTMTVPLSYTGGTLGVTNFDELNANGLYFTGHGHQFWRPSASTATRASTAKFYDAINRKNGGITDQVDISAADPGAWYPTDLQVNAAGHPTGFTGGGSPYPMNTDDAQEASRYRMKVSWQTADNTPQIRSTVTREIRIVSRLGTGQNFRDLTHAAEHGPLWATYVLPADISKIKLRETYDNFHTSVVTDAYNNALSANECPNITWFRDRLWLVWYDGTVIKQSFSQDLGTNWSAPMDLTLAGTNPRHLVDTQSGTSYYFYIDAAQSLVLKRSGDFGKSFWDMSAITVKTNVGLQTIAAEFTSSGEVVVGWIDALSGDWIQFRSQDRGMTWI